MITLPYQVDRALQILQDGGYEGFLVGGCVRDYLLEQPPKDFDITTNAKPEVVMALFDEYKVIVTGLKHGTITVILASLPLEITTYRIDGDYADHRRPDSVCYTQNIIEDLARRDFTMNAIAYHPTVGFVDPYGGKTDILKREIRAVGNAETRFMEDALRILRGVRFAAVLGFEIAESTFTAMNSQKALLQTISSERVYVELCKTLLGAYFETAFVQAIDIWAVVIPELLPMIGMQQHNPYHVYDVFSHTVKVVSHTPAVLRLRLAALLHDIGKPATYSQDEKGIGHFYGHAAKSVQIAKVVLERLKIDNETKQAVLLLVKYHDTPLEPTDRSVKRWMRKLSADLFFDLLLLKRADNLGQNPTYRNRQQELVAIEQLAKGILANDGCFQLKDLQLNGNDLILLGYQGKEIGTLLACALEAVMDGTLENRKSVLMDWAKNRCQ